MWEGGLFNIDHLSRLSRLRMTLRPQTASGLLLSAWQIKAISTFASELTDSLLTLLHSLNR